MGELSPFKRLNSFDPKDKNKLQHSSPPQSDYFNKQSPEDEQPIHAKKVRSPPITTPIKTTVNESLLETNECLDSKIKDFHENAERLKAKEEQASFFYDSNSDCSTVSEEKAAQYMANRFRSIGLHPNETIV